VNARQYEQLLINRRLRSPLSLADTHPRAKNKMSPVAGLLAKAAQTLRRRLACSSAWARLARPNWLADTEVLAVTDDTLIIQVSGAALLFDLRRQRATLERQISKLVPGVHRLRFEPAGAPPQMDTP
jgi:hypothetical protein